VTAIASAQKNKRELAKNQQAIFGGG